MHPTATPLARGPGVACAATLCLLLSACPPAARLGQPCAQHADCLSSELCVDSVCRQVCNSSEECRRSEGCRNGVCLPLPADAGSADSTQQDRSLQDRAAADLPPVDAPAVDHFAVDALPDDLGTTDAAVADATTSDSSPTDQAPADALVHDQAPVEAAMPDLPAGEGPLADTVAVDGPGVDVDTVDAGGCRLDQDCQRLDGTCRVGRCNTAQGLCYAQVTPDAECDDSIGCTLGDRCDDEGRCAGTPDDARCQIAGQLCRPECFGGPSGCGSPPQDLQMSCATTAVGSASCVLQPVGVSGDHSACLSCSARTGFTLVDATDFEDSGGACTLDGWTLVTGDACADSVISCTPSLASKECCADLGSLCETTASGVRLRTDQALNCGGGKREWRLRRSFDLTGLRDLRFCYDVGEAYATASEAVVVLVSDGVNTATRIGCTRGDVNWRGGTQSECASLPIWANDNPAVVVTVIAHSHAGGNQMRIDNLHLYGWRSSCTQHDKLELLSEPFDGCADPIADGWHGWDVTGAPRCSAAGCATNSASAWVEGAASWTISHRVDTRGVSGGLELCLRAGDVAGYMGERISLWLDLGAGAGWQRAGWGSMYGATDLQCEPVCFNLSGFDPAVAHNPRLGVALQAEASAPGLKTLLDDVILGGATSCDAASRVALSAVSALGTDRYEVQLEWADAVPEVVELTCTWGDATSPIMAYEAIDLR